MDEQNVVRLSVGARIWWHGDYWEVQRLHDGAGQLGLRGRLASVSISDLARASIKEGQPSEPPTDPHALDGSAALSSLSSQEREHVEALAVTIQRLLDNPAPLAPRISAAAAGLPWGPAAQTSDPVNLQPNPTLRSPTRPSG